MGGSSNLRFEGDVDSLMVHGPYMWEPSGLQNSSQLLTSGVKFSQKAYRRVKSSCYEDKQDVVCQRENPFYVNTVLHFRQGSAVEV